MHSDAGDRAEGNTARKVFAETVELGALGNYIGFYLRLAQNASFRNFRRHTGEGDLRQGWYAIMSLIGSNPGITPRVLATASGRDKSTLTPVLREMLGAGLVERFPSVDDRRSYTLYLTAAGRKRLGRLAEHAARHDRELDAIVGDRKSELLELLERVATELGPN